MSQALVTTKTRVATTSHPAVVYTNGTQYVSHMVPTQLYLRYRSVYRSGTMPNGITEMTGATLRNRDEAVKWWQDHVRGERFVLPRQRLPTGPGRRVLLAGGYAVEVANGQAWILKTPEREADRDLCLRNYWRIAAAVLENYRPAVVERESAVRLYLGQATPPGRLRVRHARGESRYTFELCEGLEVQLAAGDVSADTARRLTVDGADIPVDRPERTLLALPLSTLRDHLDDVAVWLQSLVISRPALGEEWARTRRPVLLRRFAEMARDAGNERLAVQLHEFLAAEHGQHVSRARAGVGSAVVVPPVLARVRSRTPWMARHEVRFHRWAEQMTEAVADEAAHLTTLPRDELFRRAEEAKSYDAYHSTTIEGYRITPEEVSAVIAGRAVAGHDPEEVRARMAVKGYAVAFDRCMKVMRAARGPVRITEQLIQDLYVDLFSPSVEAGIVEADALRGWRAQPAFLWGARHVPPSPEKIPELMQQHVRLIDEWEGSAVVRAALAHLDFVAIHPFPDGNGRIARFLMNLVLVTSGLPWTTIRTEDRARYFRALEAATADDDAGAFGVFVLEYVRRSTA
jgi:hypothetical protein